MRISHAVGDKSLCMRIYNVIHGKDCNVFHLYVVQSRNLVFMIRAERR